MPPHRVSSARLPFALACLCLPVLACDPSSGAGSLVAYWHLGGSTCADAGITEVSIRVVVDDSDVVTPVKAACASGSTGVSIADVPAGGHRVVVVQGLDEKGIARYEGSSELLTIRAGKETLVPSVALGLRRASVRVRWGFSNNLVCGANGVAQVRLTAFDAPGNLVAGPEDHPCDVPLSATDPEGGVVLSGLPANTDLTLVVLGFSVVEKPTFWVSAELKIGPGETKDLSVLLDKCEAGQPCP
jgi:hypothetical protein